MEKTQPAYISIIDHFADIEDPRVERAKKRKLGDVIAVAVCAVIRGNEITAIPNLLKLLELEGCVAAIDAICYQKKTAKEIAAQGADYVLAVKKNQPRLWEDIVDAFECATNAVRQHGE